MLVLSRHINESIVIGSTIEVTVVDVKGDKVRLGFNAPRDIEIHRKENADRFVPPPSFHCEMNQIAASPVIYGCRIFKGQASSATFDPYFAALIAVVHEDGIPEVQLYAPPPMSREECRAVRQALGNAFLKNGFVKYRRRHPKTGILTIRNVLGDEECE